MVCSILYGFFASLIFPSIRWQDAIMRELPITSLVEKPRDFDPFGQTGFAHLWLQYD